MEKELSKILREELTARREKNPSYSMRAFAAWLGVGPSALSEILAGKRKVSAKMVKKIAGRLKLPADKTNKILSTLGRRSWLAKKTSQEYLLIREDQFELIASWVHFAILSLLKIKDTRITTNWLAARLDLPEKTVEEAVLRLKRLGLVEADAEGALTRSSQPIGSSDGIASQAVNKAHLENCDLARQALTRFSVDERDFTFITMAINPQKIPEAKMMIRAFRDRLAEVLEDGEVSEPYRMSIQLFPLKG